jgi:hypothetical protein
MFATKDRNVSRRKLTREELKRLRLTGSGRACQEAVAIEHGQRHLNPLRVVWLAVQEWRADHQARLREREAGLHRVREGSVQ